QFTDLPDGIHPELSPWNAIGEVFRYSVVGKGYTLQELKTAEDWVLERQFKQVPGVIDVVSFGGETKQYHVGLDPFRLQGQHVTLDDVITGIQNANRNVGGQRMNLGEQSYSVRGVGLFKTTHDIENVVIAEHKGVPTRVRDIAVTAIGSAPRLGQVGHDKDPDIVEGVVLMRYGGETKPTLEGIHDRIKYLRENHLLPPGMDIAPYYDRGNLVELTTHTVLHNLIVGMILVSGVLILFLGDARAALIAALNIPIALLIAFTGMVTTGTSANLISLGAVYFGIVVDSSVIMMENIFRHVGPHGRGSMIERIGASASEVATPMAFSTAIIAVALLPLFTMTGVSGVIFSPMAHMDAFAIGGAIILALTLSPVLASRLMKPGQEEKDSFLMRHLQRVYRPACEVTLKEPKIAVVLTVVLACACFGLFPFLGGEFMPHLEEGNLWVRATLPTSISLDESGKVVGRMRDILRGCPADPKAPCDHPTHPEVETVVSQNGRPDDGTDVSGFQNIELFAPLAPFETWPHGMTKEKLTDELSHELSDAFPGVVFNFSQLISDNVEEALSGVKGENSVKVIGSDLKTNEKNAEDIVDAMGKVDGVKDLGMFHSLGQPSVKITPDRIACARYGLNTGDVENVVEAAIGGKAVTQVFEGEKHFDLTVRWLEPYRKSLEDIRELTVPTPSGAVVPLGQIASVTLEDGPSVIFREDGRRYVPVKFSVRGRDLTSTIADAKKKINDSVHLPYDSSLDWGGEFNELKDAVGRLAFVIPLTLLLIGLLVFAAVKNMVDTAIVLISIPVACAGGVIALLITRLNFSVSAAMGFIFIFGIAIQDAILVVTYFQRSREIDRLSIIDAAREAGDKRFRPELMTCLVSTLGLMPAALSNGIGAQTQKPLATVVIGGALSLALLSRLRLPSVLVFAHTWLEKRAARKKPTSDPGEATPGQFVEP
ncbi:MAG: efflux RND transporter permease subunit, partial [Polyangiaceae bacterium]